MTLYFPQLKVAVLVRKNAPEGAQLVMPLGAQSVYLVPTDEAPSDAEIAKGLLGGWNFANGWAIHLVYASTMRNMYHYRRHCGGKWIVLPRRHSHGGCVGLILSETSVPLSMGVTPVIAEAELAETE